MALLITRRVCGILLESNQNVFDVALHAMPFEGA
jgi:hypothetical protein